MWILFTAAFSDELQRKLQEALYHLTWNMLPQAYLFTLRKFNVQLHSYSFIFSQHNHVHSKWYIMLGCMCIQASMLACLSADNFNTCCNILNLSETYETEINISGKYCKSTISPAQLNIQFSRKVVRQQIWNEVVDFISCFFRSSSENAAVKFAALPGDKSDAVWPFDVRPE